MSLWLLEIPVLLDDLLVGHLDFIVAFYSGTVVSLVSQLSQPHRTSFNPTMHTNASQV